MKVLLPKVNREQQQYPWQSLDKTYTIADQYKSGNVENLMFFFNKPPKWNE